MAQPPRLAVGSLRRRALAVLALASALPLAACAAPDGEDAAENGSAAQTVGDDDERSCDETINDAEKLRSGERTEKHRVVLAFQKEAPSAFKKLAAAPAEVAGNDFKQDFAKRVAELKNVTFEDWTVSANLRESLAQSYLVVRGLDDTGARTVLIFSKHYGNLLVRARAAAKTSWRWICGPSTAVSSGGGGGNGCNASGWQNWCNG